MQNQVLGRVKLVTIPTLLVFFRLHGRKALTDGVASLLRGSRLAYKKRFFPKRYTFLELQKRDSYFGSNLRRMYLILPFISILYPSS